MYVIIIQNAWQGSLIIIVCNRNFLLSLRGCRNSGRSSGRDSVPRTNNVTHLVEQWHLPTRQWAVYTSDLFFGWQCSNNSYSATIADSCNLFGYDKLQNTLMLLTCLCCFMGVCETYLQICITRIVTSGHNVWNRNIMSWIHIFKI